MKFLIALSLLPFLISSCTERKKIKGYPDYDKMEADLNFTKLKCNCDPTLQGSMQPILKLGERYTGKADTLYYMELTSGSSFDTAFHTCIGNVNFNFCNNQNGEVKFISCNDRNFVTDDMRVGDSYKEVKKKLGRQPINRCLPGYAIYIDLPSGWKAGFAIYRDRNDTIIINDSERIRWFYQQ